MKIRWSGSSVRLRITPAEMERLERGESVVEELSLPGAGGWSATIRPGAAATALSLAAGRLEVALADPDRERLANPAAEGVYFETPGGIRYYIEKDYPCAHPRGAEAREPEIETFAPPASFEQRKNAS